MAVPEQKAIPKALALMSGGLDSTLAARIIKDAGIEVIGLYLTSPFGCRSQVEDVARHLGIRLVCREKGDDFLDIIQNPRYGYGSQMNPCIDCRISMFQFAEKIRQELGADFIITGEVLGQRPMSQLKGSMNLIDRKSDSQSRILRPLSAHHFPPTIAEINGWVKREMLLGISGRSRKEQLRLAKELGLKYFSSPGGGCLLTEPSFSPRVRDFFQNPSYSDSQTRLAHSTLLRVGRHFRLDAQTKVIIGRNQTENETIEKTWPKTGGTLFGPENFAGPSALMLGSEDKNFFVTVGGIISFYAKKPTDEKRKISFQEKQKKGDFIVEAPIDEPKLSAMRI